MPQYLSPGVYVEEMPSAARPIAGVGTSTAGFIGVVAGTVKMPAQPGKFKPRPDEQSGGDKPEDNDGKQADADAGKTTETDTAGTNTTETDIAETDAAVEGGTAKISPVATVEPAPEPLPYNVATAGEPQLITSWGQFKNSFGDFQEGNLRLAHAVYGFFNNGGTRCWVMRVAAETDLANLDGALARLGAIDEISIVAVPGATTETQRKSILAHCFNLKDRFAVLDGATPKAGDPLTHGNIAPGGRSEDGSYGAVYFPWITVADPASGKNINVPPSGHIAGIYARNDATRGVHKAPANEVVLGAVGLERLVSKAEQDGLNPQGVNVIRSFDGTITVWGARTRADENHSDFKYVSTRRLFMFLSESIEQGTRWVVFEPNTSALWQSITRNVTAFLTNVWRAGALFGDRPEQAFYVKCDADTNPPEQRDLGMVVTEIGVAIVRPAEFVIFRISQWAGPGK